MGRDSRDRDKVKVEVSKMKNRSGTYKIWPNPYLSKKRDYLVSAQLHINAGPNFTRNDRSKIKDYIYLCCKESSHIEKVGTEYKA